ncbi:MAG: 50S ribosomal protein L15 [Elusimicrobiota bacterium]|jgi:large subunit ribosomal protein L15
MRLDELKPAPGSRHRRKIVGRGIGSGHGAQSTRGMKGQRSRSGFGGMVGFEGGQVPLIRRIPKRGFRHTMWRIEYSPVNVGELENRFEANASVTPDSLRQLGLIKGMGVRVKILGQGALSKPLTVQAHAFSASAKQLIEKAGGRIEVLKK